MKFGSFLSMIKKDFKNLNEYGIYVKMLSILLYIEILR